ncbi:MAG: hypothetical protein ACHP85_00335 [Burkholderiales bacterium]|jgi:hypothetical protein
MPAARKPSLQGRDLIHALWRLVLIDWKSPDAKRGALLLTWVGWRLAVRPCQIHAATA